MTKHAAKDGQEYQDRDAEGRPLPVPGDAIAIDGRRNTIAGVLHRPTYDGEDAIAEIDTRGGRARGITRWRRDGSTWKPAPPPEPEPEPEP